MLQHFASVWTSNGSILPIFSSMSVLLLQFLPSKSYFPKIWNNVKVQLWFAGDSVGSSSNFILWKMKFHFTRLCLSPVKKLLYFIYLQKIFNLIFRPNIRRLFHQNWTRHVIQVHHMQINMFCYTFTIYLDSDIWYHLMKASFSDSYKIAEFINL